MFLALHLQEILTRPPHANTMSSLSTSSVITVPTLLGFQACPVGAIMFLLVL